MSQLRFAFGRELIVDLFAGGGGASLGIEQAFGRPVDIAINHSADAVAMHAANHPSTEHYISDVFEVDPAQATGGRQVGLLWASPDCKHFSKAKGGAPRSKKIRALAWVVVKWAATVRPRVIMIENVEEFVTWGPLGTDNQPCPRRKGQTFKRWVGRLRALGYKVEWKELRACDYGAPTIRKRFFLVARCDGLPIRWPAPTHGKPDSDAVRRGKLLPWRSAAECIDWSIACPSIFLSKEEGRAIGVKRPLAEATMRRIAKGIDRFVLKAAKPFIVRNIHGNGPASVDAPLSTLLTGNHTYLATPYVVSTRNGERAGQEPRVRSIEEPAWTVTGQGSQGAVVTPLLVDVAHGEVGNNGSRRWGNGAHDVDAPSKTVTATGNQALVAGFLTKYRADNAGAAADAPLPTITANGESDRPGGNPPLAVVAAHMEQANTGVVGHDARAPVSTIVGKGCTQRLVVSHLQAFGQNAAGSSPEEPAQTVLAGATRYAEVRAFLVKFYGSGGQHSACDEPMHTIPTRDRMGLVTVEGTDYVIADIGLRMLTPRELFRAQGFPEGYLIDVGANGRKLPKDAQVRACGNSVCPPLAKALVEANVGELVNIERESEAA